MQLLTRRRLLGIIGGLSLAPVARVLFFNRTSRRPGPTGGPSEALPAEPTVKQGAAVGYPTFSLTASVVSVDGAPPGPAATWQFWIAPFGYTDESKAASSKQSVVGGATITLVADDKVLGATDAVYAPALNNSFTSLWQSTMAGLVCKPAQVFNHTLEVAGVITVPETGVQRPYTARLFPPPAGSSATPFFGLMAFRLLPDGMFPSSATDPSGIARVWTQAQFLQRYRDRILAVSPDAPPRPARIQLIQNGNPGDFDRASWEVFYDILRRLGTTTTQASNQMWAPAEIQRASDIHRFSIGLYNPPGYIFPFSPGNPGGASPQVPDPAGLAEWAQSQVDTFRSAGFTSLATLTHIKFADEPSEYQPDMLTAVNSPWGPTTANKMRDEATRQATLAGFRSYLASQPGLTPGSVGYPTGFDAVPGPVGRSKETGSLVERTLYYWSMRWFAYVAARHFANCADALRATIPGVQPTVSLNNFSGMLWKGLTFDVAGRAPTADDGQMGFDWHELGRLAGLVGVDDYIAEFIISNNALRAASCVRDHPRGKMFSNEVVVANIGTLKGGLLKKVLVNTGRGSDRMQFYLFGPANVNKDGTGAEGLVSGDHAVADYQRLSRWLADTEDDLLAGAPPQPEVAVVAPRSTQMFNGVLNVNDNTQGNWWAGTMDYFCEALALVTALSHANVESHWMDEDRLGDSAYLARFKVVYLTAPCIPSEYHPVVSDWVTKGGTLVTFPGAAAFDRYNSPATGIPSIGGIGESAHTRQSQTNLATTYVRFPIAGALGAVVAGAGTPESWRTTVDANGATVDATFADNGRPAVTVKPVGAGRRVHFAWFAAQTYFQSGLGTGASHRPATDSWDGTLRAYLLRPVALAGVVPPVTLDQPIVEGLLLKSPTSTALTLLNWRAEPVTVSGTIRGSFAGSRLFGRHGEVPSTFAGGVVTFGPLQLDDCDILVGRGRR